MNRSRSHHHDRGAAMVEMAFVGFILFLLTGALVDFGVVLHRWTRISDVVIATAREQSIRANRWACPDARAIRASLRQAITHVPGITDDAISRLRVATERLNRQGQIVMKLSAEIRYPCFFCAVLPRGGVVLTSTGQSAVEIGNPRCPVESI